MQIFTVKVTGNKLTEKDIREAIWQTSSELSHEDILVEELDEREEIPMFKGTLEALENLKI